MASFDYAEMQDVAAELIAEFGTDGTIIVEGQPDEINGGDPVATTHPCILMIVAYDARYINGSSIRANDVQIYISAIGLDVEPQVGMQVSAGGKAYLIVNLDPNRFDGQTPVVFVAQGRTAS